MKKRILCLLLSVLMILPFIASCNGGGDVQTDGESTTDENVIRNTVDIDLNGYTIIRKDGETADLIAKITEFKKSIEDSLGVKLGYIDDWIDRGQTEPDDAKEIVIGSTNRKATEDIKNDLPGSCFAVKLVGSRIFLYGSDASRSEKAMEYFTENYLKKANGSVITLEKDLYVKSDPVEDFYILKDCASSFKIVYSDSLDTTTSTTDDKDRRDCEVEWSLELVKLFNSYAGKTAVAPATDWKKAGTPYDHDSFEILVGYVDRPEFEEVKEKTAINEYTVQFNGHKLIIFGWNLTTLRLAIDHFTDLVRSTAVATNGRKDVKIASDYKFVGKVSTWLTDFPEYPGGKTTYAYNAGDGALGILVEETNESEFEVFNKSLVAANFELYLENEMNGNLFKTYTRGNEFIHTYYVKGKNQVRIITDLKNNVLPPLTPKTDYTKICDYSITQMILNYGADNFGMCYVITLEDGSFIVYDGGGSKGSDYVRLHNVLKALNKRTDGIHIAAWIITHAHWDHHSVFQQFVNAYSSDITLEYLIVNAADTYEMYNSRDYDEAGTTKLPGIASSLKAKFFKPYTGQYFYIRNVKIEILYSHEALFPKNLTYFNNTTTVTRLTMGGQTVTFLGDIQSEGSNILVSMMGNTLKSDIVQVSHHGYNGATKDVYKNLDPAVLLWPTSRKNFQNQVAGNSSSGYFGVDYYIKNQLNVKEIFIADEKNVTITLPYTPGSNSAVYFDASN